MFWQNAWLVNLRPEKKNEMVYLLKSKKEKNIESIRMEQPLHK